MEEWEKAEKGMWYDANNCPDLIEKRDHAEALYHRFNEVFTKDSEEAEKVLCELLPHKGKNVELHAPFLCDYGYNIVIGDDSFINRDCYLMDCAKISIGKHCYIGPKCGFYTASHPVIAEERNSGLEKAAPVTIKDNCWLGAGVMVMPGVTIGEGCVIGAGSIVTKDIPDRTIAMGSPCRVVRKITEADSIYNEKEED